MRLEEIRTALRGLALAKLLPREMRERVMMAFLATGEAKRCQPGATLFKEGDASSDMGYVLLRGTVSIEKQGNTPVCCEAPEILGEMQQFNPLHERTASVRAGADVTVFAFSWHEFFAAAETILSREETERLREELGGLAWRHFVGTDETG
jgi:CRP-like cAMP-binding protein